MTHSRPIHTASRNRTPATRRAITLELAAQLCPHRALADKIAETFALHPVDFDGIQADTARALTESAAHLDGTLNDKAMVFHLQRIVGAFVASAHGAGQFYSQKVTAARDLTSRLANDARDEDRDGAAGFDSKAARARQFAAVTGLQAYALLAAAQGAVDAFAEVTGETWKPYEAPIDNSQSVGRRSAEAELAAFG